MADIHLDRENKYIVLESTQTTFTVQEIGSEVKRQLQLSANVAEDKAFIWSGLDDLPGTNVTGVVLKLQNGWTLQAEAQGSPTTVSITQGIILPESEGGTVFNPNTNVSYTLADTTVSALVSATTSGGGGRSLDA